MQISVRRNLAWMTLSQGSLFVLQFGSSIVMAWLLTPYEMGVYAVAAAVVGVVNMLRSFGLNSFIIREPELSQVILQTVFTVNAAMNLLCAVAIFAISDLAGKLLGDPGVGRVMQLLAITPLLNVFEFLPSARLERIGFFGVVATVNIIKTVVNITVTLILAVQGFSYFSIAWGSFAMSLTGVLCFSVVGWRFVGFQGGLSDWRRVGKFGLQMLTIGAVGGLTTRLTNLILGWLVGLSALGLYSRASSLNSLLWDNLHLVIARVVFVDFAEQHRRGMSLRVSYLRIVTMLTALLWPAFAGLAILAGPLVVTLYGETWIGAALPLSLLSVSGILLVAITMTGEVFVVSGEVGRQLRYELKRTVIGLSLFTLGCLGGLVWAAASSVVDALAAILLAKKDLKRLTDTHSADFTPIYWQSSGLTVLACSPTALLMTANGWSAHTSLLAIFASIAVGVLAWTLGLWRLQHPLYLEAQGMSRRMRQMLVRSA